MLPTAGKREDDGSAATGSDSDASRGSGGLFGRGDPPGLHLSAHVCLRCLTPCLLLAVRLTKCDAHQIAPAVNCEGCLLRCTDCNKQLRLREFDVRGRGGTGGVAGRYAKCMACTKGARIKERFKALYAAAMLRWDPQANPRKTWDELVADRCLDPASLYKYNWLLNVELGNHMEFVFAELPVVSAVHGRMLPDVKKAWLEEMLALGNVCVRPY